jgi:hypothetical protein
MKTSKLAGAALNWAVAKCEGVPTTEFIALQKLPASDVFWKYQYSTDWAQGGPIIEREGISVTYDVELSQAEGSEYWATIYAVDSGDGRIYGPTPLIAAMRCYVASKLGNTIDIPEGLT